MMKNKTVGTFCRVKSEAWKEYCEKVEAKKQFDSFLTATNLSFDGNDPLVAKIVSIWKNKWIVLDGCNELWKPADLDVVAKNSGFSFENGHIRSPDEIVATHKNELLNSAKEMNMYLIESFYDLALEVLEEICDKEEQILSNEELDYYEEKTKSDEFVSCIETMLKTAGFKLTTFELYAEVTVSGLPNIIVPPEGIDDYYRDQLIEEYFDISAADDFDVILKEID